MQVLPGSMKMSSARLQRGFSLAEILVSAALISISVIAIIAVIRKGRELDINDLHRRQARLIISSLLESHQYQMGSYSNIPAPSQTQSTVTIDQRNSGGVPLTGTLTIKVSLKNRNSTYGSFTVKKVRFCVKWDEPGFKDSIFVEKLIADN